MVSRKMQPAAGSAQAQVGHRHARPARRWELHFIHSWFGCSHLQPCLRPRGLSQRFQICTDGEGERSAEEGGGEAGHEYGLGEAVP